MKNFDEVEKELYEQLSKENPAFEMEAAFEMANVSKDDTGLPYDIWIDTIGKNRNGKHNEPRIKVQVDGKFIPVLISQNPDIPQSIKKRGIKDFPHLAEVQKYIKAYYEVLMAHYNKLITDKEALTILSTMEEAGGPSLGEILAKKAKRGVK